MIGFKFCTALPVDIVGVHQGAVSVVCEEGSGGFQCEDVSEGDQGGGGELDQNPGETG
jgi:hypothetical protein